MFSQAYAAFGQDRIYRRAKRLAVGALVGLGKKTITGILCAGAQQFEDWSAAYRLFEKERIDRSALFAPAINAVVERLTDKPLVVMIDDTLIRKRGTKVYGAGWKRDPLGPHFRTNFVWGQRYLQVSAALPDEASPAKARGIPIDFIHAPSAKKPSKKASEEEMAEYKILQKEMRVSAVAAERLELLREQVEDKKIVCAVDGGFTNRTVFRKIPENTVLIGRIRKDAKIFAPPIEEDSPKRGRRRWYGEALPTPEQVRKDESIPWQTVNVHASGKLQQFEVKRIAPVRWIGTGERDVQVIVIRPLAYRPRKGARLLYRKPVHLICTEPGMPLEEALQAYVWRWEIEVNFRDEKTVVGVGEAQVRTPEAVETAPALMVASYAFLLLAAMGTDEKSTLPRPKWQTESTSERASTQQPVNFFRAQLWNIAIDTNLTHFESQTLATQNPFNSKNSLNDAVSYACK